MKKDERLYFDANHKVDWSPKARLSKIPEALVDKGAISSIPVPSNQVHPNLITATKRRYGI